MKWHRWQTMSMCRICLRQYLNLVKLLSKWLARGCKKQFVTFPLVSWVRCGTWLYRFLIFAPLLTCNTRKCNDQPMAYARSSYYYNNVYIFAGFFLSSRKINITQKTTRQTETVNIKQQALSLHQQDDCKTRKDIKDYMGLVATKAFFGVADKVRFKSAYSATETR